MVLALRGHIRHPGCDCTPVGPGKDTYGTLGPVRGKAVGGPTTSHLHVRTTRTYKP